MPFLLHPIRTYSIPFHYLAVRLAVAGETASLYVFAQDLVYWLVGLGS